MFAYIKRKIVMNFVLKLQLCLQARILAAAFSDSDTEQELFSHRRSWCQHPEFHPKAWKIWEQIGKQRLINIKTLPEMGGCHAVWVSFVTVGQVCWHSFSWHSSLPALYWTCKPSHIFSWIWTVSRYEYVCNCSWFSIQRKPVLSCVFNYIFENSLQLPGEELRKSVLIFFF